MDLRAIVVDDEALGRRGIVSRLEKSNGVKVVAQCANGRQAVEAVRRHRPDLLFLDVQMPGMDGFDVVAAIAPEERPHVVFVTAHNRHAVKAFRVHALDYLLKPIDDERFAEALSRAIADIARARESDVARRVAAVVGEMKGLAPAASGAVRSSASVPSSWPVRSKGTVTFVRLADLDWVEAEGDYLKLHAGTRSWLVRETMASAEKRLPARKFLRIHRSTIVNVDRIRELSSLDNGDWAVRLQDGTELRLSRTYRDAVERLTERG
ncbi:MAG TPA: LytTR family DNA-binding domain-containing protein [Thermoanaerobaculia bacterium]